MSSTVLLSIFLAASTPHGVRELPVDPLLVSPSMEQFLEATVHRDLTEMQRLESLMSAVFGSRNLEFTYASVSRTASETFAHRNGNCLSFSLMIVAMARRVGLDARFREVDIPPAFSKSGAFVILGEHVNVAVFIEGKPYIVDVFPQVAPARAAGRIVSDQRGLAHFFNNMGVDELGNGDDRLAEINLMTALDLDPTMDGAYVNLGAARTRAGRYAEAEGFYRKALELSPKSLSAMTNLAGVYQRTGRIKEAERLHVKVKKFREKNPYYHFSLGLEASRQGDHTEALSHYRRAIRLNARDDTFYFAVARTYALLGDAKRMAENLQLARKYAPDQDSRLKYAQKLERLKSIRQ